MAFYDPIVRRARDLLDRSAQDAGRLRRALRFTADLIRHCRRELADDRAEQMAAALTYRTIFGLIPFLVLALLVFRAFGGFEAAGADIQEKVYDYLGLTSIELQQPGDAAGTGRAEDAAAETDSPPQASDAQADDRELAEPGDPARQELRSSVDEIVANLQKQVAEVSFTSIGVVGIVVLIWAALSLVVTVEQCFNRVYDSTQGRRWHLRIAIYWAAITLGPVLLTLSLWLTGAVVDWVDGLTGAGVPGVDTGAVGEAAGAAYGIALAVVQWVLSLLSRFAALGATWLLLFLLYVLMPNATVRLRSAVIGSLVAAILWELAKAGFKLYVQKAVGYSALYGSLGLIPLFLLWVYLTWLIVLFGLELTFTLQAMHAGGFAAVERSDNGKVLVDPRAIIPLMVEVARGFARGEPRSASELGSALDLPARAVGELTDRLCAAGLLHRVEDPRSEDGEAVLSLARPPARVPVAELLRLAREAGSARVAATDSGASLLHDLDAAQDAAAEGRTLLTLVPEADRGGADPAAAES